MHLCVIGFSVLLLACFLQLFHSVMVWHSLGTSFASLVWTFCVLILPRFLYLFHSFDYLAHSGLLRFVIAFCVLILTRFHQIFDSLDYLVHSGYTFASLRSLSRMFLLYLLLWKPRSQHLSFPTQCLTDCCNQHFATSNLLFILLHQILSLSFCGLVLSLQVLCIILDTCSAGSLS